ncbi:MAG TPA: alpha/beta hydrolase-fold protein [Chloroflexota bacterium]|nr:alpha/beta hydrolase-fold protein [Chloroflexota bacterium]
MHKPKRRAFLTAASSFAGALALHGALPARGFGAGPAALRRSDLALQPFAAGAAPFDAAGRTELAKDLLTYFVRQKGTFPGRPLYYLPAAPWVGGWEPTSARAAWDFTVPAGQPLYLLAAASPDGRLNPADTTITVNGLAVPDLADYVHDGISALHNGAMRALAVLDLVFAPPAPGRYKVEVRTAAPETSFGETVLSYDLTVQPSDALGPQLFRDGQGRIFATQGTARRQVPDAATLQALGYPATSVVSASDSLLEPFAEGAPLPALRDGMLVRADNQTSVFRLQGGRRVWLRDYAAPVSVDPDATAIEVQTIDAAVLGAIPPVLQNDMLLKGNAADVFHVDSGTLRKIPDWKWATDRRLNPADTIFVPDRTIAGLPQNSPHWIMPGGAFEDRSFSSDTLGREMPYRVFLPPDYYTPARQGTRYPVLYLLHGMGGRYDEWSGYGLEEVANGLMQDGKFPHTIVVAPQGGLGYWMNQDGGTPWGDYVARDLVKHVDATFRTVAQREARAIGGLSMGGHGAIQLALNYPDTFGIAGAHSPSIRNESIAPAYFGRGGAFARRDPITLVKDSTLSAPPRLWIDIGQNDFWKEPAQELHKALVEKGWQHEWKVLPGEHDGWYWGDHLWEYLPFYAQSFQKNGVSLTR